MKQTNPNMDWNLKVFWPLQESNINFNLVVSHHCLSLCMCLSAEEMVWKIRTCQWPRPSDDERTGLLMWMQKKDIKTTKEWSKHHWHLTAARLRVLSLQRNEWMRKHHQQTRLMLLPSGWGTRADVWRDEGCSRCSFLSLKQYEDE